MNKPASTRTRARITHREDQHQEWLFQWALVARMPNGRRVSDYLFHIPNGGKRNAAEAARLKRQGVKAGVSDMMLPWPAHGFAGLWIELKAPEEGDLKAGRLTEDQHEWLELMTEQNYMAVACWGWRAAAQTIESYLTGGGR